MSTRERILTIRLLEKINEIPEYRDSLGLEVTDDCIPGDGKEGECLWDLE